MGFRRTTWLMWGLSGFLVGLAIARVAPGLDDRWVWLTLALAIVAARGWRVLSLITILLFGLTAGWLRGASYLKQLNNYQDFYGGSVVLVGKAATDGVYSDHSQLSFDLSGIQLIEPQETKLVGKIAVEGFGEPSVLRGDIVQVEGKLFSTLGSKQGRMSFADLSVLGRDGSVIESTRRNFVAGMESALPEPQASFGLGLLIGQRSTLPKEILAILSAVGLTHIVAVSGYNLTILVQAARRLLGKRSKYQTLVGSFVLMGLFLLITGLSASIVRAVIVSTLGLLAWYWGRRFRPLLLILIAAALTAGWQPLYIWSDIGWHLSFLAFYGVLVLAPLMTKRLFKNTKPKTLTLLIIECLCAWAMTAPLILYVFKELSLVALLANVLVVPLVPLAMLFSVIAGLAGMISLALAGWLAVPARLFLTYMLDIASLITRVPRSLTHHTLTVWQLAGLYIVMMVISLIMWHGLKRNRVKITPHQNLEA